MSNEYRKKIKARMGDNRDEKRKRCNAVMLALIGDWIEAKMKRHECDVHEISEACENVDYWKSEMKERAQDFGTVCVPREPEDVVEVMKRLAEEI